MEFFKAVIDYSGMPDGLLLTTAKTLHSMMGTNAATFPNPPGGLAALLAKINAFDQGIQNAALGGVDRTAIKNAAREDLLDTMGDYGNYVNSVAKGDPTIIDLSGLPRYSTQHAEGGGPVTFVPQNARIERGNVSGAIVVRWKGDGSKSMYEVQICTGDPMVEANWTYRGSFTGGRAELDGFNPGTTLWARVRKIGTGGRTGGWSDPAKLMVT
jgi:hypothetical protein